MSEFNSIYSTVKNNIADINRNQPESVFRNVETKSSDVFAPSTATKLLAKKEEKLTAEDIDKIKEAGIKISLMNSTMVPPVGGKALTLKKRFQKMEKLISILRDPVDGVEFVDRRKFFEVSPACAPGSQILEWLQTTQNCYDKVEAKQLFQLLLDHGYLVPLDISITTAQDEQDSFYTFQADYFAASHFWKVSDLDYSIFLVRRSSKNGGPMMLNKEEIERFIGIQKQFGSTWKTVVSGAEKQKIYLHSLEKKDKRLFEVREFAFWRSHKPFGSLPAIVEAHNEDKELHKKQMTEDEYLSLFFQEPLQQLDFYEKKVQMLQNQLKLYRKDTSSACKTMVKYCESWFPLDPILVHRHHDNPWYRDETTEFPVDRSTVASQDRVALWTTSFRDLLNDELGVQYFIRFMEKDLAIENLRFYLACRELDCIQSRDEYHDKAMQIFEKYINYESAEEININANLRNTIIEKYQNSDASSMDINIFDGAAEHVYQLMLEDRYPKFICSDEIKVLLEGYVPRRKPTFVTVSSLDSSDDTISSQKNSKKRVPDEKKLVKAATAELGIFGSMRPNFSSDRFIRKANTSELGHGMARSGSSDSTMSKISIAPSINGNLKTSAILENE